MNPNAIGVLRTLKSKHENVELLNYISCLQDMFVAGHLLLVTLGYFAVLTHGSKPIVTQLSFYTEKQVN